MPDHVDIPGWKRRRALSDYLSHSEISRRAYHIYPDGELAAQTFRVIGEAMAHKNKVGLGRVTISSRERPVLVEPRGAGLVMSTLRSTAEVRPAPRSSPDRHVGQRDQGSARRMGMLAVPP